MLRDDIREVVSPFKCTTLDDLLSRARVREADLLRKKNKEAKETKRKLDFVDRDAKKPKKDKSQRSGGTQIKTPFNQRRKSGKDGGSYSNGSSLHDGHRRRQSSV
uniref:Zinc finger, CCHC-type, retrotransposon Gag domain protein n=1 Tax=Tanacetum cinerariifolium TaxID=118510 RepID=A0A699V7A3_TANCI|nr:zinc finger, CCHC-type, retrotransposon Gag domain protein [Tanacetum cinerariifolium]